MSFPMNTSCLKFGIHEYECWCYNSCQRSLLSTMSWQLFLSTMSWQLSLSLLPLACFLLFLCCFFDQGLTDNISLYLIGTLVNLEYLCVTHHLFYGIFLHVSGPAH